MISRGRLIFIACSLLTVVTLLGGTLLASTPRHRDDGADSLYKYLSVFTDVFGLVRRSYVDETDPEELMAGAYEGATEALGPFALYVPQGQLERYLAGREIGAGRSGLLVLKERGMAYVISVVEGSPADTAGLEAGDLLASLDGRSTRDLPLWEIHTLLSGEIGREIGMERIRLGQSEEVSLTLAEYPSPGVGLRAEQGVGVLQIHRFDDSTFADIDLSLQTLLGAGDQLPELTERDRLLIDLRGVTGGDSAVAYRVASLFATGEIGVLKNRQETFKTFNGALQARWQGRLVMLTNRGTQGAAEVFAAVLKQAAGALLVGDRTFGHSGRLSLRQLSSGGHLQITDAFFTGPDLEPLSSSLMPDHRVPVWVAAEEDDEDGSPVDPVLERGLEVLLEEEPEAVEQAA